MRFDNAFLQANGEVGMQFVVKKETYSVWKDARGIHTSECGPVLQAALITKYVAMTGKFKGV